MSEAWIEHGEQGDCASCGSARSRSMGSCPACGRVMASRPARFRMPELPNWLNQALGSWLRGRTLQELAFYAACVPMILPLPIAALIVFGIRFAQVPERPVLMAWRSVVLTATVNVIVSLWVWSHISAALYGLLVFLWTGFWDAVPAPGALPTPEPIPV